jgi:hypothetical protein
MSGPPSIPPDESNRRRIRELYAALTLVDEADFVERPHASFRELVAFICGNYALPAAQQELLFEDSERLADFHALVRDFTVKRHGPGGEVSVVLELRAAASDHLALRDWRFPGGLIRMRRFGPDEELLTIRLDSSLREAPTALLLQSVELRRLALVDLKRADPSFATGINIVLDENRQEDKQIIEIMQSASCEGVFVNTIAGSGS